MLLLSGNRVESFAQVITVLIIFVFVLGLTYFVTRWIASYQKGKMSSNNIETIEAHRIAQNRHIQIVRIGEKYFALGIGKDEVHVISELSKDELILREENAKAFPDFKQLLNRAKKS